MRLFLIRQTGLFIVFLGLVFSSVANAQLVDELIGQKRIKVQALLKPYRLLDYKKEREVHSIEKGLSQTVLFENDTCVKFYWMVTPEELNNFQQLLGKNGYKADGAGFVKDSLELLVRELNSGKATLFIASISPKLTGKRDAAGRPVKDKVRSEVQTMPRLQQAILLEEEEAKKDSVIKKPKDPTRHWVGGSVGNTKILGWEK